MTGTGDKMNLEDFLQCPVCFEIPSGSVLQCEQGHAICEKCYSQLTNCPVCRGNYYGTRNYVMEDLIENIRKSKLKKPDGKASPEKIVKAKEAPVPEPVVAIETPVLRPGPPDGCKGMFQCQFEKCLQELPSSRMLSHVRYYHQDRLIETRTEDGNQFTQTNELPWVLGQRYVHAVFVADMGLFFLMVEVCSNGDIRAWVQMVAHHNVARKFHYQINLDSSNGDMKSVFANEVRSVREPRERTFSLKLNECLRVIYKAPIDRHINAGVDKMVCKVTITRADETSLPNSFARTTITCNGAPEPTRFSAPTVTRRSNSGRNQEWGLYF